jgi:hypothetical protein
VDKTTQRIVLERAREQCEREDLKRPKCEKCGARLAGSRSHQPPGSRICAACEAKK